MLVDDTQFNVVRRNVRYTWISANIYQSTADYQNGIVRELFITVVLAFMLGHAEEAYTLTHPMKPVGHQNRTSY
jgi:hypothetical protein